MALTHLEYELQVPFWRSYIETISSRYQLVRYDGRTTGLSDRDPSLLSVEGFMRDLEAVVDAVGSERVVLYGISQGGCNEATEQRSQGVRFLCGSVALSLYPLASLPPFA